MDRARSVRTDGKSERGTRRVHDDDDDDARTHVEQTASPLRLSRGVSLCAYHEDARNRLYNNMRIGIYSRCLRVCVCVHMTCMCVPTRAYISRNYRSFVRITNIGAKNDRRRNAANRTAARDARAPYLPSRRGRPGGVFCHSPFSSVGKTALVYRVEPRLVV